MIRIVLFLSLLALNSSTFGSCIFCNSSLGINSFTKFLLNLTGWILAFYLFSQKIKATIKSTIFPSYNAKILPRKLVSNVATSNSTYQFNNQMNKLGNVVRYDIISENVVLSNAFIPEFLSIPPKVFNIDVGQNKTGKDRLTDGIGFVKRQRVLSKAGEMISSIYLHEFIQADGIEFGILIDKYLKEYGIPMSSGLLKIEDITHFIITILFENACPTVFGSELTNNKVFQEYIEEYKPDPFLSAQYSYNPIQFLRDFTTQRKGKRHITLLSELLETELNKKNPKSKLVKKGFSAASILNDIQSPKSKNDTLENTFILRRLFSSMVFIPPSRIQNILVDISVQEGIQYALAQEQKKVMKLYGNKITMAAVMQMKLLDAFIKESLCLSSPASCMHRYSCEDVLLSNGTTVPRGSLVSISLFSKFHTVSDSEHKFQSFNIRKNLPLFDQNDNNKEHNLVWGHGKRICPFAKYSQAQMKIIVATLLRKYRIYANNDCSELTHPGYEQVSTVTPKASALYLKRIRL